MMWYYDAGGGQQQGPISEAELDRLITNGAVTPNTLVWREGMASWSPLREARSAAAAAPISAAPTTGTEQCDSCGRYYSPAELIMIQDRRICETCKPAVVQQLQQGGSLPSALALNRSGPPWEQKAQLGTVNSAWQTAKLVLLKPSETFSSMKREGGLWTPLSFQMLLGTIGGLASLVYQFGLSMAGAAAGRGAQGGTTEAPALDPFAGLAVGTAGLVFLAVLMPLFIAVGSFIYSGILHLSLMICGGAKQPYETTFRVNSYASGAAGLLQLVPFCGSLVAGIWMLVCLCIGLSRAHEVSTGRAIIAVLLPTVVCCVAIVGVFAAFFGMAAGMQAAPPTP